MPVATHVYPIPNAKYTIIHHSTHIIFKFHSPTQWCASDRSCVAAELPYCGSERRSIEMCGAGCYPDSDKCCTSEGKVSKAGESCAVSANECVLPTGTCDGERPDCVAQFVADQSPCNNGNGACVSGVCSMLFWCCFLFCYFVCVYYCYD